jgi:hypothetical protein
MQSIQRRITRTWPNLRYYPVIFHEGLMTITKNPRQDNEVYTLDMLV